MKNNVIIACLALLLFFAVYISFPLSAAATSLPDDQSETASFLQLTATGPVMYGEQVLSEKDGGHGALYAVSIPLNNNLKAFFDFPQSRDQRSGKKMDGTDFRTVFGFHITLK